MLVDCCVVNAGKFYLVDAGYPNRPGYLAPYRGGEVPSTGMEKGIRTFGYTRGI